MEKRKPKGEEEIGAEEAFCYLGHFFSWLEGKISPGAEFREHMTKSKVEFLKGVRSFIDKRIDDLEKGRPGKADKKATKVKVE